MSYIKRSAPAVAICLALSQPAVADPSSDASQAAKAQTSEACFNQGFVAEGSLVDYVLRVSGDGAAPPRRTVIEVQGAKKFNGVRAVETLAKFYDDAGEVAAQTFSYSNVRNGDLLNYGLDSDTVRQVLTPPLSQPIAMKAGETSTARYEVVNTYPDGRKERAQVVEKRTFEKMENVRSKVGTFRACRFKSKITTKADGRSDVINKTEWASAEGKYRGLVLKTKVFGKYSSGFTINQQIDVTKVRKFKMN